MPLCERIRIDAGRSYTQTLFARVLVALALIVVTMVATVRSSNNHNSNLILGDAPTSVPTKVIVAQNDKYGR